jgi:hypothetical protein
MGEFARVIQPHLEAHDIEGPVQLARKIREAGVHRGAPEVQRWMDGEIGVAGPRDLMALERILGLSDEESDTVLDAFRRDIRAQMEASR